MVEAPAALWGRGVEGQGMLPGLTWVKNSNYHLNYFYFIVFKSRLTYQFHYF